MHQPDQMEKYKTRFQESVPLTGLHLVRFLFCKSKHLLITLFPVWKRALYQVALVFILSVGMGCQQEKTTIEGWNAEQWEKDADGCQGKRRKQWESFREKRHQFIGVSENQLRSLFGFPARKELMERGQKIYRYYVVNGSKCGGKTQFLALRVSAMHTVTEVTEE
jgi:hypothetical protein